MQIEKTTKIGELLDTKPEKAELLLKVGGQAVLGRQAL